MSAKRHDQRSGMALVTVLWTIALLSALAMAASTTFREFAGIVAIDHDRVKADALLTAGLEASAGIIGKLGEQPLTDREAVITLATGTVHIRLSDEGGRININKAPVAVLSALLSSVGASDQADAIAGAIDAWRRADEASQSASGSQTAAPRALAAQRGNADGEKPNDFQSFTDVRQLIQIPGMTQDYVDAIGPLATVYGDDKVNVLTASAAVISALPGMSAGRLDALLSARGSAPMTDGQLKQILGPAYEYVKLQARPIALVELSARVVDGYTTAVRAVVVAVPRDRQPYRVLAWTPLPPSERPVDMIADQH